MSKQKKRPDFGIHRNTLIREPGFSYRRGPRSAPSQMRPALAGPTGLPLGTLLGAYASSRGGTPPRGTSEIGRVCGECGESGGSLPDVCPFHGHGHKHHPTCHIARVAYGTPRTPRSSTTSLPFALHFVTIAATRWGGAGSGCCSTGLGTLRSFGNDSAFFVTSLVRVSRLARSLGWARHLQRLRGLVVTGGGGFRAPGPRAATSGAVHRRAHRRPLPALRV
jgi:hypothetical protein